MICIHLEIFATLGENGLLQTRPASINFEGFAAGSITYKQKLVSRKIPLCCQKSYKNHFHLFTICGKETVKRYKSFKTLKFSIQVG